MANSHSELASLLKKNEKNIVRLWSSQIFRVPGHRKYKDIVPGKIHAVWMKRYLRAFIDDIKHPNNHNCHIVSESLVFKGYLGVNTAEDVIHGQIILRAILANLLIRTYRKDFRKLKDVTRIIIAEIDKNILCFSALYKKKNFIRLKTIMKYGKKLITIHDMDKLCDLILEAAVKETSSDRGSVMLLEGGRYLCIKSAVGIPKRIISKVKQKVGSGIAGKVAKTREPIIINMGQGLTPDIRKYLRGLGDCSAVSIPIIADNRVVGVLNLLKYSKKPFFNEIDVEMLIIFAYEAGTAISNTRLFGEVHDLYIGSIISLAAAIDARDHYTHGHSSNVAKLATATARNMNMSAQDLEKVYYASMLHDIGKIGIPDKILLKPGRLNDMEFEAVKKHPIYAMKILKHIPRMEHILPIIYHEHEHFNGKGYVEGIKGLEIPLESRIIAIADAYEAMTSNRPYRVSMSKEDAIRELKRCAGTQFDPKIVRAFLGVIK